MIWGYKILFLDVLFPLNLKKIIFVDTDQIVRTDLTELRYCNVLGRNCTILVTNIYLIYLTLRSLVARPSEQF